MSDTAPYSEATVELVAEVVEAERGCFPSAIAARVLDALATAGRLVPEGAETHTEWAWECGEKAEHHPHPGPEDWARNVAPVLWPDGRLYKRWSAAGAWLPAEPEEV